MKIRNFALAFIASLLLFVSCSKDDAVLIPKLDSIDMLSQSLEIQLGESLNLNPKINTLDVDYLWTIADNIVSTSAEYSFSASQVGRYTIHYSAKNSAGEVSYDYSVRVLGKYSKGVFIINEGWFGHEQGSINFWDRTSDEILTTVYQNENEGKQLGVTTQYACINAGKLFLVSKNPDHLVVVNSETLIEEGRVALNKAGIQARGFAYQDETTGYLSTTDGVVLVDLKAFTLGDNIAGLTGEVGKMMVLNDKLFALQSKNLYVINTTSLQIEKTIVMDENTSGMLVDKDGLLWVSTSTKLVTINTGSLEVNKFNLPEGILVNKGFVWDAGCLTYSKKDNALFFVNKGGWTARTVAKFDITTSSASIFCEIDSDFQIYGAGTYIDPIANKLYVTALKGWGQNAKVNKLYVYSLNGKKERVIDYGHFYFPALCIAQ